VATQSTQASETSRRQDTPFPVETGSRAPQQRQRTAQTSPDTEPTAPHGYEEESLLTHQQYQALEQLAHRDNTYGRRAKALIALHQGKTQAAAGSDAGLAPRTVRYWLARFRKEQLGVFPDKILNDIQDATETPTPEPAHANPSSDSPGIVPDDTMPEAARKTLRFHFECMLDAEAGTRADEDIEELHEMRVATRRMRAALKIFKPYIDWKAIKSHRKAIKRTSKALGAVRDLDVYYEKTQRYIEAKTESRSPDLDPLMGAWTEAHRKARDTLIDYLDGDRYCEFKETFEDFLDAPMPAPDPEQSDGTIVPHRVRHVVPTVIYERLAHVRAFNGWILKPDVPLERYHRLRIAAKNLRYALEFFEEMLGPETDAIVDHLKVVQDHLGDLQDAIVATQKLRNFWMWGTLNEPKKMKSKSIETLLVIAPDVARYHADKQGEIQELLDAYPDIWQWFLSPDFSALIARAVSSL
jgi:CHAD domain-containing protein